MILIIDIDNVIADASWRKGLLPDWDAFHAASSDDQPFPVMVELINVLHNSHFLIFLLTGRPEKWRQTTNEWLIKHNILVDEVFMRPDNNYQKSPDFKLEFMRAFKVTGNIIIIDDRDDVCTALRGAGYNVMHARMCK